MSVTCRADEHASPTHSLSLGSWWLDWTSQRQWSRQYITERSPSTTNTPRTYDHELEKISTARHREQQKLEYSTCITCILYFEDGMYVHYLDCAVYRWWNHVVALLELWEDELGVACAWIWEDKEGDVGAEEWEQRVRPGWRVEFGFATREQEVGKEEKKDDDDEGCDDGGRRERLGGGKGKWWFGSWRVDVEKGETAKDKKGGYLIGIVGLVGVVMVFCVLLLWC